MLKVSEVKQTLNLKILFMAFLLPIIVIWIIDSTLKGDFSSFDTSDSFTRFANAILTSYTLGSLVLLGNLFFYADSRKRPLAPLFGMVLAVLIGILATLALIGMGPMLLEANGSVIAQTVYNIGHTIVSFLAISLAVAVCIGSMFATLTNGKKRKIFHEEE
uniref:Uncharacterized protein n=1 Tax=uncultured Poseidoniia archaeon TaxID=1697135 RepID=A0A1B1TBI7_9ARCH|nr:hypothetical protein MG2_0690 [uncultured Candidatus Thalassoarchaea sp.]